MFLGIEIGGTKLQLGVSPGDELAFTDFRRVDVRPHLGAGGIRDQILEIGRELISKHPVQRLGIGFGGPVDSQRGRTIRSHQIDGWEDFPLVSWCQDALQVPTVLGNDCDVASLAEARYGAGKGRRTIFYVTIGTGVGGGFVVDGQIMGQGRPAIAEIGHLRPGLDATDPHSTVESLASGWAIAAAARREIQSLEKDRTSDAQELISSCGGELNRLTTLEIAARARSGNQIARHAIDQACRALGWGLGQVVTLLAPEVIVLGGGVSLMGNDLFLDPVRRYVDQYTFPPLRNSFVIAPAELGERVVVYGAVALAAGSPAH